MSDCHRHKMLSFFIDMIDMNEIKENNYDVNVLWKGNIPCLWVLKTILFQRLRTTPILVDHEIGCIENLISLPFHAYEKHKNQRSYVSCTSI
jgi:hypothetical protein